MKNKPNNSDSFDVFIQKFTDAAEKVMKDAEGSEVVADMIYKAATDSSNRMSYTDGKPRPQLLVLRTLLSNRMFFWMVKKCYNL